MKKHISFLLIIIILSLSACNTLEKEYEVNSSAPSVLSNDSENFPNFEFPEFNNTTPYDELITKEVDIHFVVQKLFTNSQFGGTRYSFQRIVDEIGVECLRKSDGEITTHGSGTISPYKIVYTIHKVKQGGLLYMFYKYRNEVAGEEPEFIFEKWSYVRNNLSYSDFDGLTVDKSTLEDCIEIDDGMQIHKNLFYLFESEFNYTAFIYTNDGIVRLCFKEKDDKVILVVKDFYKHSEFPDFKASRLKTMDFSLLEIDRPN